MRLLTILSLLPLAVYAQKPNIRVVEGQGAINVMDGKSDRHLTVLLEQKRGVPWKEIPITFSAPASGASGTFKGDKRSITVKTDDRGYAVAPRFRPNQVAGRYNISVSALVSGGELRSAIPQTNALADAGVEEAEEGWERRPKRLIGKVRSTVSGWFN